MKGGGIHRHESGTATVWRENSPATGGPAGEKSGEAAGGCFIFSWQRSYKIGLE